MKKSAYTIISVINDYSNLISITGLWKKKEIKYWAIFLTLKDAQEYLKYIESLKFNKKVKFKIILCDIIYKSNK